MPLDDSKVREQVASIEALLGEVETLADPGARDKAVETIQSLLDLYGEGLARVMAHASRAGAPLAQSLADDDLISHLLLLHDLHPDDLETRVTRGVDTVRPALQPHGASVELLGVTQGVVRLRLHGGYEGSPSSAVTLKRSIEEAIHDTAPDIDRVEIVDEDGTEIEEAARAGARAEVAAALGTGGTGQGGQRPAFVPLSALGVGGGADGHDQVRG